MKPDFAQRLQEEEVDRQKRGMPPAVRRAVLERLQQRRSPRRAVWAGAAAFAACAAGLAIFWVMPAKLGDYRLEDRSSDFSGHASADGVIEIERGQASLLSGELTLRVNGPTRVRRDPLGL